MTSGQVSLEWPDKCQQKRTKEPHRTSVDRPDDGSSQTHTFFKKLTMHYCV